MATKKNTKSTYVDNIKESKEQTVGSPSDKEIMEPKTKKGIIEAINLVRVRKSDSIKPDTIGYVRAGDEVEIIDSSNEEFYKISFTDVLSNKKKIGYIISSYCKEV